MSIKNIIFHSTLMKHNRRVPKITLIQKRNLDSNHQILTLQTGQWVCAVGNEGVNQFVIGLYTPSLMH